MIVSHLCFFTLKNAETEEAILALIFPQKNRNMIGKKRLSFPIMIVMILPYKLVVGCSSLDEINLEMLKMMLHEW
jgi:hypothetical protein